MRLIVAKCNKNIIKVRENCPKQISKTGRACSKETKKNKRAAIKLKMILMYNFNPWSRPNFFNKNQKLL